MDPRDQPPLRHWVLQPLLELFTHRDLVAALVWRDLRARYRGSSLGFLWTFVNPLLFMAIYSLVFVVYMRVQIPAYPAFLFAGLLPWNWFATTMLRGAHAILESGDLLRRVAFPPQVLPAATAISALVNFLLSIPLLLAFLIWFGVSPGWTWLALILPLSVQFLLGLGVAIATSVLSVVFRDLYHLLAGVITLWFFLTPIVYPAEWVPARLQPLLLLNPVTPFTLAFQDVLYHGRFPHVGALALMTLLAALTLGLALWVLQHFRWRLAEEV